jgi:sialic acid synthase SpsE
VMSSLKEIIKRKQAKNIAIVGKGASIDKVDLANLQDFIIINMNDSEVLVPGDICVFHDAWVLDFLKKNEPKCDLYFSDKEIDDEVSQVLCDFIPSNPEAVQFLMNRFFSDKIYLEQHLILSALRIADEIGRIDGTVPNCFLLGFDFSAKTGYTNKMAAVNHHTPDYSEHMVSTQENSLIKILAQEHRLSIKINHVGNKPYSAHSVEEFNKIFPKHDKFKFHRNTKIGGSSEQVEVVAEITTNHQGDMSKLLKMITLAKDAGADYVKLQKRDVDTFYSQEQLEGPYDSPFGDTFRHYRHGIELTRAQFKEVDNHCRKIGIRWFVSILDRLSFDYMDSFDLDLIKLPSTISEHKEFLSHVASTFKKDIVISTGYTDESYENFILENFSACRKLYLMQCTSAYPCPMEDAQIAVIRHYSQIAAKSNIVPGFSSHDVGSLCSMMAVAAGARMIEKHVKLDSVTWAHFDDVALDLGTGEFKDFVSDIRKAEVIVGTPKKSVRDSEHHKYWLTTSTK